jgi:hypothetical protein
MVIIRKRREEEAGGTRDSKNPLDNDNDWRSQLLCYMLAHMDTETKEQLQYNPSHKNKAAMMKAK